MAVGRFFNGEDPALLHPYARVGLPTCAMCALVDDRSARGGQHGRHQSTHPRPPTTAPRARARKRSRHVATLPGADAKGAHDALSWRQEMQEMAEKIASAAQAARGVAAGPRVGAAGRTIAGAHPRPAVSRLRRGALVSCLAPRGPLFVHVGFFFCATCACIDADLYIHVHDVKKIVRDTKGAKSSVCGWLGSAPQRLRSGLPVMTHTCYAMHTKGKHGRAPPVLARGLF